MDREAYFARLNFSGNPEPDITTLNELHRLHVLNVPFENLSIHCEEKIVLSEHHLFYKVVNSYRGGFCYELNFLFFKLLSAMKFSCKMVSASIANADGSWGPTLDHLCVIVKLPGQNYLADVGYGDLFLQPIEITPGKIQSDGRNNFRIVSENELYILQMFSDTNGFENRYRFELIPRSIEEFEPLCNDKQINADSYFVKNLVCTRPTEHGRTTIFNDQLTIKNNNQKKVTPITSKTQLSQLLKDHFGISISSERITRSLPHSEHFAL